ncbi:32 kDa beta-galactoside-binding lectin lec-3-like [Anopheles moucheti]|uniref:32 kDa beta-galactoside-binding lectin lec-3-like n=1 Tax=Anopheles moucheti TaxID=186751 RepID=UPI0022F02C64|nr:32 kDa beta-galactoside-binding lectin lec-3-like [Anopheles moucheti]
MALMLPLFNPDIPCLGAILGGLSPGKKLIVQGTLTDDRFNINLQYGPEVEPRDDTALHLSIRPRDRRIVRNTYVNQCWQDEERSGGCPIGVGEPFTLEIRVKETHYSIRFNEEKHCSFSHRMPYEMVNFIHLGTGAAIDSVLETF